MTQKLIDPRSFFAPEMPETYLPWKADYGRNRTVQGCSYDDLIESIRYDLEEGFEVEYTVDARRYEHEYDPREEVQKAYSARMNVPANYGMMYFRIEDFATEQLIEDGISQSDAVFLAEVCCFCKDHFTMLIGPHDPTP